MKYPFFNKHVLHLTLY